jgi:hypothetical protein
MMNFHYLFFSSSSSSHLRSIFCEEMKWSHATNSLGKLNKAIKENVDAIECDVILGEDGEPILAHPPRRTSDLTVDQLLHTVTDDSTVLENGIRNLQTHLKLDFKEEQAIKPTLDKIRHRNIQNPMKNKIYLNADILAGPGRADFPPTIPASAFLEACLGYIASFQKQKGELIFAFSLGYTCNYSNDQGYLETDVAAMASLVEQYLLVTSSVEIVLALNARLLHKSLPEFDSFLSTYPSKILAWTGNGEPPIPGHMIDQIRKHYSTKNMEQRIDFDCDIKW